MSTQVSRLLLDPNYADPQDPKFSSLRALNFLEIREPLVLNPQDPWEGPGVHFASPDTKHTPSTEVDYAVKALTGSEVAIPKKPVGEIPSPPAPSGSPTPAEPGPKDPLQPTGLGMNTPFLDGVFLDDHTPGVTPLNSPKAKPVDYDPWDPKNAKKVQAGAKIKMGP